MDEFAADERPYGCLVLRTTLDHGIEGDSLNVVVFAGRYVRRGRFLLDMSFLPAELWRVTRSRGYTPFSVCDFFGPICDDHPSEFPRQQIRFGHNLKNLEASSFKKDCFKLAVKK